MKNKRSECSVKPLLSESGLSQTLSKTVTLTVSVSLFISVANLCSNFPTCRCVHLISTLHLLLSISSPTTTTPQNHLSALSESEPSISVAPGGNGGAEERVIVLVIGTGGREHSLCHALKRSPSCNSVLCAPGNPGITSSGDATCVPDLDVSDSSAVISFCRKQNVGLVVVGPEVPLDFDRITEMRFYSQLDLKGFRFRRSALYRRRINRREEDGVEESGKIIDSQKFRGKTKVWQSGAGMG
ncbi:hypothetical protein HID58_024957 [Brassica napus]|uniref:Phosphoribosylglycinamide synthetase N-terminal domain-containing protein n=1 Tax=Brassica napus TaxID=3708 RepID=A0ABQ8CJN5_BRANA|nr:hypothetical protein HID58_024957 [Brassica napus]